jgi:ketosteroid isomerase-like protein
MNRQANLQLVQNIYAAFGRGDIDFIINSLADDVRWVIHMEPNVPWSGDFSGKSRVPGFFQAIFDSVRVDGFEPTEFYVDGNAVVSLGYFACTPNATGKSVRTRWVFIWKIESGKVVSYEQFHDPALSAAFVADTVRESVCV